MLGAGRFEKAASAVRRSMKNRIEAIIIGILSWAVALCVSFAIGTCIGALLFGIELVR